jgi:hypothetical protein
VAYILANSIFIHLKSQINIYLMYRPPDERLNGKLPKKGKWVYFPCNEQGDQIMERVNIFSQVVQ